jgi:hypothetical protein
MNKKFVSRIFLGTKSNITEALAWGSAYEASQFARSQSSQFQEPISSQLGNVLRQVSRARKIDTVVFNSPLVKLDSCGNVEACTGCAQAQATYSREKVNYVLVLSWHLGTVIASHNTAR